MTRYAAEWRPTRRTDRLIIEAELSHQPWFRRPVVIMAFAGAVIAIAAALLLSSGAGAGIDPTTTGAVDQVDPALAGMPQFQSM